MIISGAPESSSSVPWIDDVTAVHDHHAIRRALGFGQLVRRHQQRASAIAFGRRGDRESPGDPRDRRPSSAHPGRVPADVRAARAPARFVAVRRR